MSKIEEQCKELEIDERDLAEKYDAFIRSKHKFIRSTRGST